eukprot:Amastigsp_a847192_56.p2 type:complete len:145 gc:universal Amastigsp_a847192_56:435-869(+)
MTSRNSEKSRLPEFAVSTAAIICSTSSTEGSKPSARMATRRSSALIVPRPSVSKQLKASRISSFCCSVSRIFFRWRVAFFSASLCLRWWVCSFFRTSCTEYSETYSRFSRACDRCMSALGLYSFPSSSDISRGDKSQTGTFETK